MTIPNVAKIRIAAKTQVLEELCSVDKDGFVVSDMKKATHFKLIFSDGLVFNASPEELFFLQDVEFRLGEDYSD